MCKVNGKFLVTAYKSYVIKIKLDEDLIQRRFYFLTFLESLELIFSQYKETCEVLLFYPTIGGDNVTDCFFKFIRNLLHANIDVHIRRLIAKFPRDGVKCIAKLQSHCANMSFAGKIRYDRIFQQFTHKGGESAMKYIKIFQNAQALSVSVGRNYSKVK